MIKNFLNISDLNKEEIISILTDNTEAQTLKGKNLGLLFEKHSTRTRLSFTVGILSLGGNPINIQFEDLNISRDESFEDTFRAMNCYLDGLVYRTSNHKKLIDASKYFSKPIINALSDYSHPCQILSDLYTIYQQFGSFEINILWMGDMNNVCFSLIEAANIIDEINLTICAPENIVKIKNWPLSSNVKIINNIQDLSLNKINCVMTDVFISMNDKESESKIELLKPYCVSNELMSNTNKNSVFMHCLPAKIGFEVNEDVFNGPKSIVWKQAYNRMVVQKKLMNFIKWN